jgi:mannose-6-phosphate isomerase-like protein (cupin superfamily)
VCGFGRAIQTAAAAERTSTMLEGRARFTSANTTVDVEAGLCLFVKSGEPHRFHDISEDLVVLVVFGPAECSRTNPTNASDR